MVRKELKYNLIEKKFVFTEVKCNMKHSQKNTNLMYDFDSEGNLKSISILLIKILVLITINRFENKSA